MMNHQTLSEDHIYQGPIFDLVRIRVRLPNEKEHNYDLVKHHGAVTILPVDAQGNIWFVRQYRVGAEQHLLELPAGLLEEGEEAQASAGRELREEVGLAAGQLKWLGEFYMVPGYSTEKMQAFLATELYESILPTDEDEFIEKVAIPVAEVYRMVYAGQIQDGKTLATLLLAQLYLNNGTG
jgi:ADP-ribose pyrophosphatase